MICDDEISETDEVSNEVVSQVQSNKSEIVLKTIQSCDTIKDSVELACPANVSKGIWKQVSYSNYKQVEEQSEQESPVEEPEQPAEVEDSSQEVVENIEEIVAEMQNILKDQKMSKLSKYKHIIRESIELTLNENEDYDESLS